MGLLKPVVNKIEQRLPVLEPMFAIAVGYLAAPGGLIAPFKPKVNEEADIAIRCARLVGHNLLAEQRPAMKVPDVSDRTGTPNQPLK